MKKISLIILSFLLVGSFFFGYAKKAEAMSEGLAWWFARFLQSITPTGTARSIKIGGYNVCSNGVPFPQIDHSHSQTTLPKFTSTPYYYNNYTPPSPPTPPKPKPACGISSPNNYFDENLVGALCSIGSPTTPAIPSKINNWTWNWSCISGTSVSCKAYKNAQCDTNIHEKYVATISDNDLCETGDASDPIFDGAKWTWNCKANESSKPCEAYKNPNCRLQPEKTSICPGDIIKVEVKDLVPPGGNSRLESVVWNIPGVDSGDGDLNSPFCDSFTPDFTNQVSGSYTATYTVTDVGGTEKKCSVPIYVKPASCTISLGGASNLTVGEKVEVSIKPSCLGCMGSDCSYTLPPTENWSYPNGSNDINNGEATIEVKKAGSLDFKATVTTASGDQTVTCSSQASAFTSGSEWWERKPE